MIGPGRQNPARPNIVTIVGIPPICGICHFSEFHFSLLVLSPGYGSNTFSRENQDMESITENDSHLIVPATSSSGRKFQLGYPKAEGYAINTLSQELTDNLTAAPAGYKELRWVPGQQPGYVSPAAEKIGITQGYVSHDRGPIYAYRINFYNSKGWHFTFIDESGDTYGITTIRNGWHYIDYNSDKPIVIGVE